LSPIRALHFGDTEPDDASRSGIRRRRFGSNRVREKSDFARRFNVDSIVQPFAKKYSTSVFQNHMICFPPSRAHRGALRDRHERGARDAMDATHRETNDVVADGEVVWVRPDGASYQWRQAPYGQLSIGPVADERFSRATGWTEAS
jgi:hypothetical protein